MITEKVTLDCRLRPQIIYLPTNVSGGPPWSQAVFYGPGFPPPVLKADKSPDPMEHNWKTSDLVLRFSDKVSYVLYMEGWNTS